MMVAGGWCWGAVGQVCTSLCYVGDGRGCWFLRPLVESVLLGKA